MSDKSFVGSVIRRLVAEAQGDVPDAMARVAAWVRTLNGVDTLLVFAELEPLLPPGDLRDRARQLRAAFGDRERLDPRENPSYSAEADDTWLDVISEGLVDWTQHECQRFVRAQQRGGAPGVE